MVAWKSQAAGRHGLCDEKVRGNVHFLLGTVTETEETEEARWGPVTEDRAPPGKPSHLSCLAGGHCDLILSTPPMQQFSDAWQGCPTALHAFGGAEQFSSMTM